MRVSARFLNPNSDSRGISFSAAILRITLPILETCVTRTCGAESANGASRPSKQEGETTDLKLLDGHLLVSLNDGEHVVGRCHVLLL